MSEVELTKAQDREIELIKASFGPGEIKPAEGGVLFVVGKSAFLIGPRGKVSEVSEAYFKSLGADTDASSEEPPVPEEPDTPGRADEDVEPGSQTSPPNEETHPPSEAENDPAASDDSAGSTSSPRKGASSGDAEDGPAVVTPDSEDSSPQGSGIKSENGPVTEDFPVDGGRGPSGESGAVAETGPETSTISDDGRASAVTETEQVTPESDPLPDPAGGPALPTVDSLPQEFRTEAFEAMSLADERQVMAEMEGQALSSFVYGFKVNGTMVYGLSWIGAREAVRAFNARTNSQIRIDNSTPPQFEDVMVNTEVGQDDFDTKDQKPRYEDRPAIRVSVYGMDANHGGGQWGTATVARDQLKKWQNRKLKVDENGYYERTPDGFAANKALSKAQRNALEPQIPRAFVEALIALYVGEGKIDYIEGTGQDVTPERPPALTTAEAKAAGDKARELYIEVQKIAGKTFIPPARFNQMYTAVQHDQKRLDDFVEHMSNELDGVKEQAEKMKLEAAND